MSDQPGQVSSPPTVIYRVVCQRHQHAAYITEEREAHWFAQSFDRTHGTALERCSETDHWVERAEWQPLPRRCAANAGRCEYPPSHGDLCPQHEAESATHLEGPGATMIVCPDPENCQPYGECYQRHQSGRVLSKPCWEAKPSWMREHEAHDWLLHEDPTDPKTRVVARPRCPGVTAPASLPSRKESR